MEKRRSFGSYFREKRLEKGIALRTARDADISAEEWLRFAEMIQQKHKRE